MASGIPRISSVAALGLALFVAFTFRQNAPHDSTACRYLPGDEEWPSNDDWQQLNASVSGRLIATLPAAHVCHDPTYNAEACAELQESWYFPWAHFDHPAAFMSAYHQNASCDPFGPQSSSCEPGHSVEYVINVTEAADVVAGVKFAQEKNVRLVIKNTGHDYLGKSTGKGALGLWMHHLKSLKFIDYTSDAYTGKAVKMGAGVQAFEAFEAADEAGLQIVGGQCITVGLAGGFTQGGGHSLLSSKYGMGADQTLEWAVVTANGTLVTASPTQNSDLYWALSGGGAGTFGITLSLTAKAYPDSIMGGVSLAFQTESINDDKLWDAFAYFHETALPPIVDAGAHVQWVVWGPVFYITEATIPDATEADMREIFALFTDYLTTHGIPYQMNVTSYPTYLSHAEHYIGPFPYGTAPSAQIQGGLMFSRATVARNNTDLVSLIRDVATTTDFWIAMYALNASRALPSSPNAVLPAWRDALSYLLAIHNWNYSVPFAVMDEKQRLLTQEVMPPLQEYASGAYMSETDFMNPRWKEEFYGENWERLSEVKRRWDPEGLLYATTAVGSESWEVAGDGRLCRAGSVQGRVGLGWTDHFTVGRLKGLLQGYPGLF
ncbi:hypothetical protein BDV95DRAFT_562230 [Massariosphaeria phaeospora]|uniref:FAD-binding PCMH-type domain-containing protein n=1 Tax=Massariosphaeria phaeospora TaxID=100035 RepID=A0A7C8IFJ6_9PLEO|nr:hypothetical protein BDV95DRAFT_562230 [Massariosphaeria phaeospora]